MKKILVPIDNSKVSKGAVLYAASLAAALPAEIILLSVINASNTPSTLINWRKLEEQLVSKEQKDALKMIKEVNEKTGTTVTISYKYVLGYPVEEMVEKFVKENSIDFVVMGTAGAKGVKKVVGTNTASVIDMSSVPVVAVPKDASAQRIRKIVYATDMAHLDDEIKTVVKFAQLFDASIDILYVTDDKRRRKSRKELEAILIRIAKYPKIRLNTVVAPDIAKGVDAFVMKQKADMLAMFTHRLDFFEKLFGKSITRKLAFHSHVPLLAFNKSNF